MNGLCGFLSRSCSFIVHAALFHRTNMFMFVPQIRATAAFIIMNGPAVHAAERACSSIRMRLPSQHSRRTADDEWLQLASSSANTLARWS
jgi:hypothetical protein